MVRRELRIANEEAVLLCEYTHKQELEEEDEADCMVWQIAWCGLMLITADTLIND